VQVPLHAFYRAGGFRDYTVQLVKLLEAETSRGADTPAHRRLRW
jgi:hypothetical protein